MNAPLCAATKDMVEGCILTITLHEYQASAATNIKQASARACCLASLLCIARSPAIAAQLLLVLKVFALPACLCIITDIRCCACLVRSPTTPTRKAVARGRWSPMQCNNGGYVDEMHAYALSVCHACVHTSHPTTSS